MTNDRTKLTHTDEAGKARMVDVSGKKITERVAVVEARVRVAPALAECIRDNTLKKGDVLGVARLAGIQAAKRTDELIPLCHSVPLEAIEVQLGLEGEQVVILATARATWKTGVEMEAFTAAAVAALTVVDMGKAIDRGIVIESIRLIEKKGGRSGHYIAGDRP